ncbi:MAG: tetratricopeptide repeat protein, partial [Candidatus Wallbacteria bacterium]|nr:tetratricopeptide repeat protein [Candidatus Wallbacteria bacterium]
SILLVSGDELAFPLFYAQYAEKIRTDIMVVDSSLISIPWYRDYLRKYLGLEPEALSEGLAHGGLTGVFSAEKHPGETTYFFNNYGHLYALDGQKELYLSENDNCWKNLVLPYGKPLDSGEKRIKHLYASALRNYSSELAGEFHYSEAAAYITLSRSLSPDPQSLDIQNAISRSARIYEEYRELTRKDQEKKLALSIAMENAALIQADAALMYEKTSDDRYLNEEVQALWKLKDWNRFQTEVDKFKDERQKTFYLLRYFLIQGKNAEAKKLSETWVSKGLQDQEINLLIAQVQIEEKNWPELGKILDSIPEIVQGWNLRARYYYRTGQTAEALSYWRKVLEEDPENAAAISGIGMLETFPGMLLGE